MKKALFIIPLLIFLSIIFTINAQATDYYVKNGGDDSKSGTSDANAWKTLSKVSSVTFSAGDTIHFNKGDTWRESAGLILDGYDGSPGSKITITSYGSGADPIINGASVETTWTVCDNPGTDNMLSNGKFTSNTTGWTAYASAVLASIAGGQDGNCLRITENGENYPGAVQEITSGFAVGDKLKAAWYVKTGSGCNWKVILQYYDGAWKGLYDSGGTSPPASWTQYDSGWQTVPESTTKLRLRLESRALNGSGDSLLFDEAIVFKPIYEKSFTNEPRVIVEDGTLLTDILEWDTDLKTTFAAASAGNWSVDGSNNLYVWCTDNADPDTHTMEVAAKASGSDMGILVKDNNYITIDGIHIKYTTNEGIIGRPKSDSDVNYFTVQNCTITGAGRNGIMANNSLNAADQDHEITEHRFYNNTVDSARQHGIHHTYEVINGKVDYNTISYCGWGGFDAATGGHGISQWSNTAGAHPTSNIIEHNTVHHTYAIPDGTEGSGIQCDGGTDDSIVRYNQSYDNENSGFYDNGGGHSGSNNTFYYNLAWDNTKYGIYINNTTSCEIYNNVFYSNTVGGILLTGSNSDDAIAKNNICAENGTYECRVNVMTSDPTFDYNCDYHSAGGNFMRWKGTDYNWADWKTNSGQDTNSVNSDPLMTDPANDDFTLQSTSPCIDAGTDVGLTTDYAGNPVPQGTGPDIGAYENQDVSQSDVIQHSMNFLALFILIGLSIRALR